MLGDVVESGTCGYHPVNGCFLELAKCWTETNQVASTTLQMRTLTKKDMLTTLSLPHPIAALLDINQQLLQQSSCVCACTKPCWNISSEFYWWSVLQLLVDSVNGCWTDTGQIDTGWDFPPNYENVHKSKFVCFLIFLHWYLSLYEQVLGEKSLTLMP